MAAYLLTWNPQRYPWSDIADDLDQLRRAGRLPSRWSCGVTKSIRAGDRVYLLKQGRPPRGIMGAGVATGPVFEDRHWDAEKARAGLRARFLDISIEQMVHPFDEAVLDTEILDALYPEMDWHPQSSGTRIPDAVAARLALHWQAFLRSQNPPLAQEVAGAAVDYPEGSVTRILVNAYERSAEARRRCLEFYGTACSVCGLDFGELYGEIGLGFIHVHHLAPIAELGDGYVLDPIRDLRPVCPNCHEMLHQKDPPYSIGELKTILDRAQRSRI